MQFRGRNRMLNDAVQLSLPSLSLLPFLSLPPFFFYTNYKIPGPDRRKTFAKHPRTINHISPFFLTMALADLALPPRIILYVCVYVCVRARDDNEGNEGPSSLRKSFKKKKYRLSSVN